MLDTNLYAIRHVPQGRFFAAITLGTQPAYSRTLRRVILKFISAGGGSFLIIAIMSKSVIVDLNRLANKGVYLLFTRLVKCLRAQGPKDKSNINPMRGPKRGKKSSEPWRGRESTFIPTFSLLSFYSSFL